MIMMKYEAMTAQQHYVFNAFNRDSNHSSPDELLAKTYPCSCCGEDRHYLQGALRSAFSHELHLALSSEVFSDVYTVTSYDSVALLGIFKQEDVSWKKSFTSLFHWYPNEALIGEWMLGSVLGPVQRPSYANRLAVLRERHMRFFPLDMLFGLLFMVGLVILPSVGFSRLFDLRNQFLLALAVLLMVASGIVGYSIRRRRLLLFGDGSGALQKPAGIASR